MISVVKKEVNFIDELNPYESLAEFSQLLVGLLPPLMVNPWGRKADIKIFIDFSVLVSSD